MTTVSDYTALLYGREWYGNGAPQAQPIFLTYSFETAAQSYLASLGMPPSFVGSFQAFGAADQSLATQALNQWANACGITFLQVAAGHGDIQFGKYDLDLAGFGLGLGGVRFLPECLGLSRHVFPLRC